MEWSPYFTHMPILNFRRKRLLKKVKYLCNLGIPSKFEVSSVYFNTHLSSTSSGQEGRMLWFKGRKTYNQQELNLNPRLANRWLFIYLGCHVNLWASLSLSVKWEQQPGLWDCSEHWMRWICAEGHRNVNSDHFSYNNSFSPPRAVLNIIGKVQLDWGSSLNEHDFLMISEKGLCEGFLKLATLFSSNPSFYLEYF